MKALRDLAGPDAIAPEREVFLQLAASAGRWGRLPNRSAIGPRGGGLGPRQQSDPCNPRGFQTGLATRDEAGRQPGASRAREVSMCGCRWGRRVIVIVVAQAAGARTRQTRSPLRAARRRRAKSPGTLLGFVCSSQRWPAQAIWRRKAHREEQPCQQVGLNHLRRATIQNRSESHDDFPFPFDAATRSADVHSPEPTDSTLP